MPPNLPATHHVQTGDVPYESPVLRPPSPTDSIDTEYGPDDTDLADQLLTDAEFERKVLDNLRINDQTEEERYSERGPILLTFLAKMRNIQPGSQEERALYKATLGHLQQHLNTLIEDELVENMMLKGSQVPSDTPSAAGGIDEIMRSVMGPSKPSSVEFDRTHMFVDEGDEDMEELKPHYNGFFGSMAELTHAEKGKGKAMQV